MVKTVVTAAAEVRVEAVAEAPAAKVASKNAHVHAALKEAILSGRLPPGTPIDKAALCATLDVSRFPVAAALSRLAIERLVVVAPRHGSFVAPIVLGDMLECMMMRSAIEGDAAAMAAERRPAGLVTTLNMCLSKAKQTVDPHAFYQLDVAFHAALLTSLRLTQTAQVLDSLRDRLERIRRILVTPPGRPSAVCADHAAVRDAIAAGDSRAARTAMRRHLDDTTALFRDFARANPTLFSDQR